LKIFKGPYKVQVSKGGGVSKGHPPFIENLNQQQMVVIDNFTGSSGKIIENAGFSNLNEP